MAPNTGKPREKRIAGSDELAAHQGAGSSAHVESEKNTITDGGHGVPPRNAAQFNAHSVSFPSAPRASEPPKRALEGPSGRRKFAEAGTTGKRSVSFAPWRRGAYTLVVARGRKYLTGEERARFLAAACAHPRPTVQTFALTLAHTGCRISEALSLRAKDVDLAATEVRFRTLKRRNEHWRAVPVPEDLVRELALVHGLRRAQSRPKPARRRTHARRRHRGAPSLPQGPAPRLRGRGGGYNCRRLHNLRIEANRT